MSVLDRLLRTLAPGPDRDVIPQRVGQDSVAVIVGTYGDRNVWTPLAARALRSCLKQTVIPDEVIRLHHRSLHDARNTAARSASADWLCFLDADDELEPDYIERMLAARGDVRYPLVRVRKEGASGPEKPAVEVPRQKNLLEKNHIVIGAFVRRELFLKVGGFEDQPALEDWIFWLKTWVAGADIQLAEGAVYRVMVREKSRNQMKRADYEGLLAQIRQRFEPEARARGLI